MLQPARPGHHPRSAEFLKLKRIRNRQHETK
jgi:hypothetical protein